MERSQRQSHRRGLSRRQVLKAGAATGVGLFLPRAAVGATPARQSATPSTISGTFRAMSWESEAEMRKWRLHIDRFFQTYYPNMTPQIDYGISWDEYWTKLQTTIAGGAQLDMCWMHDSRAKSYA